MGDWADEFGSYYEIPGFLPFLVRKKVVKDLSWHNDVSPSFGVFRTIPSSSSVRLWVDHPFESHRETGGKRFVVTVEQDDDRSFEHSTDDLEDALKVLFNSLADHHKQQESGPLEWEPPKGKKSRWDDPIDYLETLKEEYLEDPRA